MSIESLNAIGADQAATPSLKMNAVDTGNFADHINNLVVDMNEKINTADTKLKELAAGETSNIHDVLLSIQKAKLSFELGLQIRNRLLEGYQEVMRMQV